MTRRIAFQVLTILGLCLGFGLVSPSYAQEQSVDSPAAARQAFENGIRLNSSGDHYAAAIHFFNVYTLEGELQYPALGHLTESLMRARLPNSASYFFIKALQSGNRVAIQRVLKYLPEMIDEVGGDLLRKYVLRHTSEGDYDATTRNHFFYFLGKDALLKDEPQKALQALAKVSSGSGIMAQAAYVRGAAYAILNQHDNAAGSFKTCRRMADRAEARSRHFKKEYLDLEARCTASLARAYYQRGSHEASEEVYDEIPKASFVWTDVLFEQAWNAYAKGDYNRALGKLVTYRSPSLNFVFNPEVDILRAQSFLSLCAYEDVNKTVNEFNDQYAGVGLQIKNLLLKNESDFTAFYGIAKQAYSRKLHNQNLLTRALNRFIRGPYFAGMMYQERNIRRELSLVQRLANQRGQGRFSAFLEKVLNWRTKTVRILGGVFVRNSLADLYQDMIANFDKMSFIKLEMLKHSKQRLERKALMSEDENGVLKRGASGIDRKDYQYFWTFNGEFWLDELGDYVFALESQCGG
ncbi:MAG: hypothetical protein AB1540_10180 [Bdellovibrionota bacterium]